MQSRPMFDSVLGIDFAIAELAADEHLTPRILRSPHAQEA